MLHRLTNLFAPTQTPEQFTAEAASHLKNAAGVDCKIIEPLELEVAGRDQKPTTVHLANAYALYLQNKGRRKQIIEQYTTSLVQADAEGFLPRDIIPTIKDKSYIKEMSVYLESKGSNPAEFFVVEEYNAELDIVYAVDSPASIRFLNSKDLAELELQGETLLGLALGNLKRVLPPIEVLGAPPLFALSAGGMFESSLLLLDRVWNKAELGVKGEILVAVPSRETLLVADSSAPQAIEQLQRAASDLMGKSPYRLTDKLFVRREAAFVPWNSGNI